MEKCPRLLQLVLVPGSIDEPDGPPRNVTIRCELDAGHPQSCSFPATPPVGIVPWSNGHKAILVP